MTIESHADGGSEAEGGPKRGRRLKIAAVMVVLAGLAVLSGFLYERFTRTPGGDNEIPLIRAEDTPTKMRPEEPGGMAIPNQDKVIYEALGEGGDSVERVERLLPPPDEPLPPPMPSAPAETAVAVPEPVPPAPPAPEPEIVVVSPPPAPAAPAPQPAAPQPKATPVAGGYVVQLASFRSADAARTGWKRLLKSHRDLLGSFKPNVQRADLGADKGIYYRLRTGALTSRAAARSLCKKLKSRNQDCLVVKQ